MAMGHERLFDLQEAPALFKIKYEKLSENVYNSANVLLGRVKKSYNFTGKQLQITIPQSFSGGVGSGTLPKANTAIYSEAIIKAKKMYATVEIDRETIKAALADEGAFVRATKEVVKKAVESFNRNLSRALFNDGSGALGTISAAVVADDQDATSGTKLTISDFKEANWEERDLVDIAATDAGVEILEVLPDTQQIIVKSTNTEADAVNAPGVFDVSGLNGTTGIIYMQGSKDNDPEGLKGVLDATSGQKYEVDVKRRFQAIQEDASQAAVSTDLLNKVMLKIKKSCGKSPNLIVCSFKQYEKILNL